VVLLPIFTWLAGAVQGIFTVSLILSPQTDEVRARVLPHTERSGKCLLSGVSELGRQTHQAKK
jgi:hypothetical protein